MVSDPYNVVLITVDALREDHLGYTGRLEAVSTPNIDTLADESVVFSKAYANGPHTRASFPSILTGTYGWGYGGYDRISSDRPHIAQTFKTNGFRTGGFHSNPYLGAEFGYDRGFDTFQSGAEQASFLARCRQFVMERFFGNRKDTLAFKLIERAHSLAEYVTGRELGVPYVKGEVLNEMALEWLREAEKPSFAWIHYMDVHDPYLPHENSHSEDISRRYAIQLQKRMIESPDELSDDEITTLKRLYKGEIEYVDHCIGNLTDSIDDLLGEEETVICLLSDHGEAFGEHGYFRHPHEFHEEVSRIPLLFRHPDHGPTNVDTPASNVDVLPTLADSVDIRPPDHCPGSILLSDEFAEADNRYIFGHTGDPFQGKTMIADQRWKYILDLEEEYNTLYNLCEDPKEKSNLVEEETNVREELDKRLRDHLSDIDDGESDVAAPQVTADVQERLKQLGYK